MLEKQISVIKTSIDSISAYMTQAGKGKKIAELSKLLNNLRTSATTIMVCGEFKRGKSTFINAFIGRIICPTDVDICTSAVSIIKYGEEEKATRIYGDFSNLKSEIVPFDSIEKYTVGSAEEIGNTICMELELPLDELKKGLIIIDTPGVGGLDPRHATLTNYFLPQADVVLFMTDVNEPITKTELKFYKERVLRYAKHSAIIVNKADLKDKESVEEIRKDTVNKVSAYTQLNAEAIDIVSVSAADCIREEDGLGNFPKLHDLVYGLVNDYKSEQLHIIRDELLEQIDLAIRPILAQIAQIESPSTEIIQPLINRKNETTKKMNDLSNPQSEFRSLVNRRISAEKQELLMSLNRICVNLSTTEFNKLISNDSATTDGRWLGQQIYNRIDEISSEITLELNKAFNRIASMKEFDGLLSYTAEVYQGQFVAKEVDMSVPIHKRIMAGMSGYGIAGASMMFLSGIGLIAGLGAAAYVAARQISDVGTGIQQAQLRQIYLPQIQIETQNLRTFVDGKFNNFQQELFRTIANIIKGHKDSIDETINEIQKVKQQIQMGVTKKAELQNRMNPLIKAKDNLRSIDI